MRHSLQSQARRMTAGLGIALAGLLLLPGVARADSPTVTVDPDSGGPGTKVTVTGKGFCAKPSCGLVRVTISGQRFGTEVRPDGSGAFASTTQAPGGLTAGEHEIVATQSLDDGNEITASATFIYSPSKGEAAEREGENRDAVNNLVNPSAPPPATRGIPLESAVAQLSANPSATLPPAGATVSAEAGEQDTNDGFPVVLVASVAAGLAALVAGALWWRRRKLGGAS